MLVNQHPITTNNTPQHRKEINKRAQLPQIATPGTRNQSLKRDIFIISLMPEKARKEKYMKISVMMMINDGCSQNVEIKAFGTETANIAIMAATISEAQELLSQAEEKALELMKDWKPEEPDPEEEKPQKHYLVASKSIEDMEEDWKEYEESPKGQRFIKRVERAKEFNHKHSKSDFISISELYHLANKYQDSLLNGFFDISALAYQQGYKHGQKAMKNYMVTMGSHN